MFTLRELKKDGEVYFDIRASDRSFDANGSEVVRVWTVANLADAQKIIEDLKANRE